MTIALQRGASNAYNSRRRRRMRPWPAAAGVLFVALAGCSSSGSGYGSSSSATAAPAATIASTAPAAPATVAMRDSKLGAILVDANGMSLYAFDQDTAGATTSACVAKCATVWPALTVSGAPTAGPGVTGQLSTPVSTSAGSQVAWNGKLLYRFSGDHAAGDTNGDGIGGVWHVVKLGASTTSTTVAVGGY